jgi:hypothetical protein
VYGLPEYSRVRSRPGSFTGIDELLDALHALRSLRLPSLVLGLIAWG